MLDRKEVHEFNSTIQPYTPNLTSRHLWVSKLPSFRLAHFWQLHSDVYKYAIRRCILSLTDERTHKAAVPSKIEMLDHSLGHLLLHWIIQSKWLSYILRKEDPLNSIVACIPVSHSFRAHWIYGQGEWLSAIGGKKWTYALQLKKRPWFALGSPQRSWCFNEEMSCIAW